MNTKNLATQNSHDFIVAENGSAFISQRKLAELCGVDQSVVSRRFASIKIQASQGVTEENAVLCITYYAVESKAANDTARKSLALIAKAGIRAYIYHEAGYMLDAKQKHQTTLPNFSDEIEAAQAWIEAKQAERAALAQIEADRPKVEFAMAVRNLSGSCLVEEFAKTLGIGRNKFFQKLRDNHHLMANNMPYQKYIDAGWFVVVEGTPFTDSKGKSHPSFTTRITGRGQIALEKKFRAVPRAPLVLFNGGMA